MISSSVSVFLLTVGFSILSLELIMILLAFSLRSSYKPLQFKLRLDTLVVFISSLLWFLAFCQSTNILEQSGAFADCRTWGVFIPNVLGINLFLFILTYRMFRLHTLRLIDNSNSSTSKQTFSFSLILSPYLLAITFSISIWMDTTGSLMPAFADIQKESYCTFISSGYRAALCIPALLQLILLFILNNSLSRQSSVSFDAECKEMRLSLFFTSLSTIISTAMIFGQSTNDAGNSLLILLSLIGPASFLFRSIGPAIYGYFFNREKYLEAWNFQEQNNIERFENMEGDLKSPFGTTTFSSTMTIHAAPMNTSASSPASQDAKSGIKFGAARSLSNGSIGASGGSQSSLSSYKVNVLGTATKSRSKSNLGNGGGSNGNLNGGRSRSSSQTQVSSSIAATAARVPSPLKASPA